MIKQGSMSSLLQLKMKILGNVIKSQSDQRLYRAIKLKNEIECLIITDQQAKKSSAALSVGVGSLQDPFEAQGLAHYLEHMLFMGTKKYPDENDYSNFIAKNFGMSNAYTSQQQTNYHFQVSSNAFEDTLDRFAQFFISPIMSDSSSERQLNAVHSQHSKNIQNDMWRKFQLSKHIAKPGHPFSKFSTGDKYSLSNPNLRELLHNFYQKNYSSNLMKLVVYGDKDPDEMSRLVEQKFSDVPNKNYERFKMLDIPYAPESFGKIYKIAPIKDKKVLDISWILPDQSKHYQNSPGNYLSHLLGHQGKGSLLSFLIKQGLAVGLSCSSYDSFNLFSEFQVSISLTSLGIKNVNKVIQYVLFFIDMLQKSQPQEWVFRQIQAMNKMRFDFQQQRKGMSFASGLVKRLHDHSIQQVLAYPYFMKEWKPQLIRQYLSHLKNDNMMVFLQAKEVQPQCNLEQPIYKTKYAIEDIHTLSPRKCQVSLPQKNIFIPKDFSILPLGQSEHPTHVKDQFSDQLSLFLKRDHRFGLPKIVLSWRLYFLGGITAKQAISRQIYFEMLNEYLRQFVYLGETAQANSNVSAGSHFFFDISISGFRDSSLKFTVPYFEKILGFRAEDEQYFNTVKQKLKRNYENHFLNDPFRLAYGSLIMALRHNTGVPIEDKLAQIDSVNLEDVKQFGQKWRKQLYIESYIGGNLQQKSAIQLAKSIDQLISKKSQTLPKSKIDQVRAVSLPPKTTWVIEEKLKSKNQENSAVIVHFQHQATTVRSKVLQDLCIYFVKQPAFDYLRTKQQLGYIVMCMPDDNRGVLGISILVQSAIKTSYELSNYVDIFLKDILSEKLSDLKEEQFSAFKGSLRNSKLEKDKNLLSESERFINEINKHAYLFNRSEVELKQLETITLAEFKNFINLIFYINCKRVEVHSVSHKDYDKNLQYKKDRLAKDSSVRVVPDPETFRKKMSLYPDFYGHL